MASEFVSYLGRLISVRSAVQLYLGPFVRTVRPVVTSVIAGRVRFGGRRRCSQSPRGSRCCSIRCSTTSDRPTSTESLATSGEHDLASSRHLVELADRDDLLHGVDEVL